jgi:hypothetical protein
MKNKAPLEDVGNAKNTPSATLSWTQAPSCTTAVALVFDSQTQRRSVQTSQIQLYVANHTAVQV